MGEVWWGIRHMDGGRTYQRSNIAPRGGMNWRARALSSKGIKGISIFDYPGVPRPWSRINSIIMIKTILYVTLLSCFNIESCNLAEGEKLKSVHKMNAL